MIVNLSGWHVGTASDAADALRCPVVVVADKQRSTRVLDAKWQHAVDDGREALVDFKWYRPATTVPAWFRGSGFAGRTRTDVQRTEANRREFFDMLAQRYPAGPLVAPSGRVDDVATSMNFAREVVHLRDGHYSDREVLASVAISRNAMRDASVLTHLAVPHGVQGVILTVLDQVSYPSVWSEDEWFGWLRLVGTLSQAGHRLVLGSADLRGLIAQGIASGPIDFSTGITAEDRQAPLDPKGPGGGGAKSPVAYLSAPLLAIMHGERLAVDAEASGIAVTYNRCSPYMQLGVTNRSRSVDPDWRGEDESLGERINTRITRHLRDLSAIETWVRSQGNSHDAVHRLLSHAAVSAVEVPGYVFKTPATKDEIRNRLAAYERASGALGL